MSFWKIMNLVAWGLSILILAVMTRDFIKVEKQRKAEAEMGSKASPEREVL